MTNREQSLCGSGPIDIAQTNVNIIVLALIPIVENEVGRTLKPGFIVIERKRVSWESATKGIQFRPVSMPGVSWLALVIR
jgi:hypothetical protein